MNLRYDCAACFCESPYSETRGSMSKIIDNPFQDVDSEADLSFRVSKLQDIVCYLVHRNEELSQTLRELRSSQSQDQVQPERK